jgi:phosphoadenosine phosphosulfate reductase
MRYGTFRNEDLTVPIISINEIYQWMRDTYGIWWIAAGERSADSVIRGAMIKHSGSIDPKRGRFFPVAWWTKQEVLDYIKVKRLYRGIDSRVLGSSFTGVDTKSFLFLKEHFPTDYQRTLQLFPLAEGAVARYKVYGKV